ncbi:pyruvate ferredoxin oxidoreductase subunit gamma [Moorella thermoacetica]|uniref:NADH-dependent phenylglyoxylate dehydrogenase subunit gamma n=2 Tax=Neomoorella thermoacetica TaxID=1525 RepID=A0A1J5NHF6_NEOTH|nr:2-oxoacid:acceptor oxidoreductase family protein [Moorella thermoacetica]AKX93119.1 NADH-dependent phenylglyoxylate dehydrogenase subunit gamma [Moorella thermoacetica]AKX95769.1 NADH-dependent phenylglyoxylate dehydrogenase subunit gamma [Moorella thermoacetica]APC07467.1 NADH-dependent phenylglyoxylate dehydrogenase subunit gamma [Moorella thermoacetica]OIQ08671.1 NADH-dependent phenylglyoxylate dehydrogenase subunit gamma [Moorella thermoacetica]OIQ54604.1 NADH-dependent phenylglyoxylate
MLQLKLYGLGGQGVVTAAKVLASAIAIQEGRYAQAVPAYGHERRGAPVYADLIVDDEPILVKSFVYQPDYVLIFDLAVIEKGVNVTEGAHKNTCFVANSDKAPIEYPFSQGFGPVYYADATKIALEVLNIEIPNSAMLGAFAATGVVKIDSVCAALQEFFQGKAGDKNVEAARRCYTSIQRL